MNAVIYARYSSSNQTELSIQGQLQVCNKYAAAKGYTVIDVYADRAISGKTATNRPAFMQMIEDSDAKDFSAVLVYQLDRFARSRLDSNLYKARLRENGVRVFSAREDISTDASGILMEGLLESLAEYYSHELSQKVKRGLYLKAQKGLYSGAAVTPGYKVQNKRYVIDKTLAPVIQRIYAMYLAQHGINAIVRTLKQEGIKNAAGNALDKSAIRRILTNPRYTGLLRYGEVEVPNAIPRLISDEAFLQVQERIARR